MIDNLTVEEIAKKIAEVESTSNTRSELMAIGNCSNPKEMDSLINLFSQDCFTEVNTSVDQIVTLFARLKLGGTATLTEPPNLLNVQFRMNVPNDDNYSVKHTTTTASKYLDFVKAIQLNSNSMGLWADAIEFQLSSGYWGRRSPLVLRDEWCMTVNLFKDCIAHRKIEPTPDWSIADVISSVNDIEINSTIATASDFMNIVYPMQPQSTSMDRWNNAVEIEIFHSSEERQSILIPCGLLSVIDWLRNYRDVRDNQLLNDKSQFEDITNELMEDHASDQVCKISFK